MELVVLGSSSRGNCYLLRGITETLILEAGVPFLEVKKEMDFDISKILGVLVTHEHMDHAKYIGQYIKAGIPVYASRGTIKKLGYEGHHRVLEVSSEKIFSAGGSFRVIPFDVIHDAAQPFGYLISHPESGVILFATDTHYLPNRFDGVNNMIMECNYSLDIANANIAAGAPKAVRDRVLETHMELSTFKKMLKANDVSGLNNVVMVHLSDGNSNAKRFQREIEEVIPGKKVTIADKGTRINLNKHPF